MANLFLSYQRDREATVKALAADLETLGHTVWFDHELSGGEHWWTQILAAVRSCDVFLFVLDPKSLASVPCQREFGYAHALHKRILPVLAADGVSLHLLPPELSAIQFVDLRERTPDAILRLARALNSLPLSAAPPDPLPPEPGVPLSPLGRLAQQIDTPAQLSHEAQSVLLLELKRSLADPALSANAEPLLAALRRRPDLLASIAAEIDAIPKAARGTVAPIPAAHASPVESSTAESGPDETTDDRQIASRAFWIVSLFAAIPSLIVASANATKAEPASLGHAIVGVVTGAGAWLSILIIGVSRFTILLLVLGAAVSTAAWVALYAKTVDAKNVAAAIVLIAPAGAVVTAVGHRLFTWWRGLR